jgi:hypothetical protein
MLGKTSSIGIALECGTRADALAAIGELAPGKHASAAAHRLPPAIDRHR